MRAVLAIAIASTLIACGSDIDANETLLPASRTTATPTAPSPTDTSPPTAPSGLTATADGPSGISLVWQASTDNVGVTSYRVERCQGVGCSTFAQIALLAVTSFTDSGLTAATSYSYRVRAVDAAANLSAYSNVASAATTSSAPPTDTSPPSAPNALTATADGPFGISLSWQPSTDNVGVTGYRVERCQGAGCSAFAQIASPTATSFSDAGLTPATSYSYRVRAIDAAANLGAYSSVASATTDSAPPPPPPGSLPAWVSALVPGQWFQIPNTAMSSVEPSPQPDGNTGPQSKVIAWTSFVVDTRTSKVYSAANGGHNDYAGNEVDVLDLEVAQPAWSPLLPPTPNGQLTNCQSYYSDGRPVSRHSYYGVTLNEFNDRIMLFGGAHWCVNGGFHAAVSSYNIGTNSWSPSGTHPSIPGAVQDGVATYAVNPATGDVYVARSFSLGRWNRSANTFTVLSPSGSGAAGDESMSAFDTTRGRILFLGGLNPSGDRHYYTPSTNNWTQVTLSGPNAANVSGAEGAALVYVAAIDRFLVRLRGSGGAVYQIHPSTFEVTTFTPSGSASVPSTTNGPYNKFLYVPRLQGSIYVPTYSGNAWFLRVH